MPTLGPQVVLLPHRSVGPESGGQVRPRSRGLDVDHHAWRIPRRSTSTPGAHSVVEALSTGQTMSFHPKWDTECEVGHSMGSHACGQLTQGKVTVRAGGTTQCSTAHPTGDLRAPLPTATTTRHRAGASPPFGEIRRRIPESLAAQVISAFDQAGGPRSRPSHPRGRSASRSSLGTDRRDPLRHNGRRDQVVVREGASARGHGIGRRHRLAQSPVAQPIAAPWVLSHELRSRESAEHACRQRGPRTPAQRSSTAPCPTPEPLGTQGISALRIRPAGPRASPSRAPRWGFARCA